MKLSGIVVGAGAAAEPLPKQRRSDKDWRDPGFVPTLVRKETMRKLRKLQKNTPSPHLNLKWLSEACILIALENGSDEVVNRANQLKQRSAD